MKIAIYGKKFDADFNPFFKEIIDTLSFNKVDIIINKPFYDSLPQIIRPNAELLQFFSNASDLKKDIDVMLSIGGDGTFLDSVTYVQNSGIPIAGINSV